MTTQQIGEAVRDHCERGEFLEAVDRFYATNVTSIEPVDTPHTPAVVAGFDPVRRKSEMFQSGFDIHSTKVEGPFVDGDRFALRLEIDATHKESGQRMTMTEMALYDVKDGKIVREEFFYNATPPSNG